MISWIQRTFQHHFRIVFAIILVVMVVPLVMIYRAGANGNGNDRQAIARNFFEYNLGSAEDQRRLIGDAQLSIQLRFGSQGPDESQVENYALQRAAALHLAREWHLPQPTDAQKTEFIKNLRAFADESTGQFDPKRYAAFRQSLQINPSLSEADILRVVSDDVRAEAVERLLGGPGYVQAGDVRGQLIRGDTTWTVAIASLDYASFDPGLKPADADLQRYFQANLPRYEIPPRLVASYVEFPAADYVAEVKLTDAEVRAAYDANPASFDAPSPKAPASAAPAKEDHFALARPKVEAAVKLQRAKTLAIKAGSDFVFALYDGKVAAGAPLDAFLASRHLAAKPLAPFAHDAGPAELGGSPEIAEAAFQLTPQRYYSDALPSPAGAAVLIWKATQPARQPLFFDVRAKVLADYLEDEKRQRFAGLGPTLRRAIEARLKAGDSFAKAVTAAAAGSSLKVSVKTPAPFTLRSRPADLDASVIGELERLEKGQFSDLIPANDQGYIVCALDKKLPDLSEAGPAYAQTRLQIAALTSRLDAGAVLSEMVSQELKRTDPAAK